MLGDAASVCKAKKTLRNNSQQHATGYANGSNNLLDIQQFLELLANDVASVCTELNPFAPGDFAEKRVLKLVEWFSGHCHAIKS